jgi:stage V sporulation protein G
MQISETRIKLVQNRSDRLKAYCSVTFDDDFVVRDLKIIEGVSGYFVAMPSRKITGRCPACGAKNHLRAKFCNECGKRLTDNRGRRGQIRTKLHADIAHPINSKCREMMQTLVVEAYKQELEASKQPDYVPTQLDEPEDDYINEHETGGDSQEAQK